MDHPDHRCVRQGCGHSARMHGVDGTGCDAVDCDCLEFLGSRETMPGEKAESRAYPRHTFVRGRTRFCGLCGKEEKHEFHSFVDPTPDLPPVLPPMFAPAACCGCICRHCKHQGGDGNHTAACLEDVVRRGSQSVVHPPEPPNEIKLDPSEFYQALWLQERAKRIEFQQEALDMERKLHNVEGSNFKAQIQLKYGANLSEYSLQASGVAKRTRR